MVEGLRDHPALGFWEVSHSKIIDHYIHTLHFHLWNFITVTTGWEFFDKNIALSVQFFIQHEFKVMNEAEGSMIPGEVSITFDLKSLEMCTISLLAFC